MSIAIDDEIETIVSPLIEPDESILKRLRDAALVERDELVRFQLRGVADELDAAIRDLYRCQAPSDLTAVNGYWVHAMRLLCRANPNHAPSGAGLKIGAELAA